jgi:formylglycine-generating enzyme required for sulfatase activity
MVFWGNSKHELGTVMDSTKRAGRLLRLSKRKAVKERDGASCVTPLLRVRHVMKELWNLVPAVLLLGTVTLGCDKPRTQSQDRKKAPDTLAGTTPKVPLKELAVDLGRGLKLEMVLLPAGKFVMGASPGDKNARDEEKPPHQVRISKPFYIGKYLLTQEQWEAVMGESSESLHTGPKNPVDDITFVGAQRLLGKLNAKIKIHGWRFALPTEAQWEFACRAGSTTMYCFGNDATELREYAWYNDNSGGKTHPVGEKRPNAWGLYDMHGNVGEYCRDMFDRNYYRSSPEIDPTGPTRGADHVLRGGNFLTTAVCCRSSFRYWGLLGAKAGCQGLRVALVERDESTTPGVPPAPRCCPGAVAPAERAGMTDDDPRNLP